MILEIDPYVISLSFFFNERIIAATSNFQGMPAKNDSLLQKEEIVRIYANSKYLDEMYDGHFFIFPEYILSIALITDLITYITSNQTT